MQINPNAKYIFFSLLASSIFAVIAPFAVAAEQAGLAPVYTVVLRYFILVAVGAPFVFYFYREHFNYSAKAKKVILIQGFAGAILNLCYLGALSYIPLSLAVILFFTFPFMTLFLNALIFKVKITTQQLITFFAAFVGLIFIIGPQFSDLNMFGIALALIAAFFSTVQLMCLNALMRETHPVTTLFTFHFLSMIVASIIVGALLYLGYIEPLNPFNFDMSFNFAGVIICYIMGFGLISFVSKHLQSTTISLLANIEPVVTIIVAVLLFSEVLSIEQVIGIGIVISSLIVGGLVRK